MGSANRLSEIYDGPPPEDDLIVFNHFERIVKKFPNEPAIISRHQPSGLFGDATYRKSRENDCLRWTFSELWQHAETFGKALLAHDIPTNRPVAVFLRNQAEWALAFWTSIRLGITFAPMHPKLVDAPVELKHQLGIVRPGAVIAADAETAEKLQDVAPDEMQTVELKIVTAAGHSNLDRWIILRDMLDEKVADTNLPTTERTPQDAVTFYFTGGTTSLPKPAPLTSANYTVSLVPFAKRWHTAPGRRIVGHLPTFHSYGNLGWLCFWLGGGCVVFPAEAYSPVATLDAIEIERCTDMPGNPAMVDSLINHPTAASRDLESLIHINLGGSIVHPDAFKKIRAPPLSVKYTTSAFGMTEACVLSVWDIYEEQPEYKDAISVGKIVPGAKLRICAPGTRDPVPWGEVGELHFGNPYIYKGYKGRNEDWLYTEDSINFVISGDQASLGEQGELYILGRYKDLIIRGGRNISPAAIEAVLNVLPGVNTLVVGLADEVAGEVPVAVVQYADGAKYADKDIRSTVASALGQASSPQRVMQLRDLGLQQFPLTAAGKPDKKQLAAVVSEYCANNSQEEQKPLRNGAVAGRNGETRQILADVWAELSAQSSDEIAVDQSITNFADSLLILQATSLIEKRTGKPVTAEDVLANPTIEQQTLLLDRRASKPTDVALRDLSRTGPPTASEIAHVRNNPERHSKTKAIVSDALSKFNLKWDDVEDAVPCYDNARFMLDSARRSSSWCHRFAFAAEVTIEEMRQALIESLRRHAMFRSIAVKFDSETWIHVVLRLKQGWIKQAIRTADEVISEEDLPSYRANDPEFDHASSLGLLFKATILSLQHGKSSGAVINVNHSMYDALSTSLWLNDLNLCLNGRADQRPARVPYKLFADAFYFGRHGSVARNSCDFFVRKLQGCAADERAQWPVQRAPGWMMGEPVGWVDKAGCPRDPSLRPPIDPEGERCGQMGISVDVKVSDELQTKYGVSLVALCKTAVAIFNVHKTRGSYALFSHWEAGRMFPFLEDNPTYTSMLPNPMDVVGPTGERVVDKIDVAQTDRILGLLLRIQDDATATSRNAHAPLFEIKRMLAENEKSSTATEDAEVFYGTLQRQVFNWVPQVPELTKSGPRKSLRRVQQLARGDLGFAWIGQRTDRNTVNLNVWWDDAQMGSREAREALEEVVACVRWMMESENLQKDVEGWWREWEERT